ncbi:MAG: molybdate ABC transporter substrate-binding protein [Rhodospirillaceae bacterium]
MRLTTRSVAKLLLFAALFVGPGVRAAEPVRVYAAASLTGAFVEISKASADAGLGPCACVHAASSTLARQIVAGAPAEIFVSANSAWMDFVVAKELNAGPPRLFTGNSLVLVTARKGFQFKFASGRSLADAVGGDWLALADPDHVPAGLYAKAGLMALGHWDSVIKRIARAANVRAALALVARDEAIAGVVYGSDVAGQPRVWVVDRFPPESHPPIRYMAALIGKQTPPQARTYFDFLASPQVAAILARYGFRPMS